jgi:hypothetical protein
MELETHQAIEKIAQKIKCKDVVKRLAIAKEINELAKLIIEMKKERKCQKQ